ncbi:MAG: D-2-hydroxyacid dehydrogenase [Salinigranum sp.]
MDVENVVVLNYAAHGVSTGEYAAAIRERLPEATVEFAGTPEEERELVPGAEVVTGKGLDESLLPRASDLRLFACLSAGVEHLPLDALRERGVAVTNASGVHGPGIAEHVVGWLLTLARRLDEGIRRQERREWRHFRPFGELAGSTVTVVGLGAIGRDVVRRLDGFDVHTVGVRYTPEKGGPTDEVVGFGDFHGALGRTDYLVLATPLTGTTRGLVDETALGILPADAAVVNVSRGPVVETDALVDALRRGRIRAAALDVTDPEPLPEDHPLWNLENVLLTPHVAGYTPHYFERLADLLAQNVERLRRDGADADLENRVA